MIAVTGHVGSRSLPSVVAGIVEVRVQKAGSHIGRIVCRCVSGILLVNLLLNGSNGGLQLLNGGSLVLIDGLLGSYINVLLFGSLNPGLQLGSLLELVLHGVPGLLISLIVGFTHELPVNAGTLSCRVNEVEASVAVVTVPAQVLALHSLCYFSQMQVADAEHTVTLILDVPEAIGLTVVIDPDGTTVVGGEGA